LTLFSLAGGRQGFELEIETGQEMLEIEPSEVV
jgi:hypothetical protein